jgi:hypothetical protein
MFDCLAILRENYMLCFCTVCLGNGRDMWEVFFGVGNFRGSWGLGWVKTYRE